MKAWELMVLPGGLETKARSTKRFIKVQTIEKAVKRLMSDKKWGRMLIKHKSGIITDTIGDNVFQLNEVPLSRVEAFIKTEGKEALI